MKLSKRLDALAQLVPYGLKVVDVGCDHGFLPCILVQKEISPFIIGVDVHKGPYKAACRTVEAYGLTDCVDVRLGDGLLPVKPGEAEVAILAGIGGSTIKDILEQSPLVVEQLKRLILQPMTGEDVVRHWLTSHGWVIVAEEIIAEDGRLYQIIAAEKGQAKKLEDIEVGYGPLLIKKRHELLPELLKKDVAAVQDILAQLAKSESSESQIKHKEFQNKLAKMKELEEWLSAAKQS